MKTTIYELLGMIKDGKAPKKIMWRNEIYNLYEDEGFINYKPESIGDWLLNQYLWKLNDEVEILETTITYKQDISKIEKIEECDFDISKVFQDLDIVQVSQFTTGIVDKINEIIEVLNNLK